MSYTPDFIFWVGEIIKALQLLCGICHHSLPYLQDFCNRRLDFLQAQPMHSLSRGRGTLRPVIWARLTAVTSKRQVRRGVLSAASSRLAAPYPCPALPLRLQIGESAGHSAGCAE
jgi:hypothetical protein